MKVMARLVLVWALGWFSFACAASQSRGPTTAASAPPPLPTTALTAMPVDAEAVLTVDVERLRASEAGRIAERARKRSCLGAPALDALWAGTGELAYFAGGAPTDWALALQGPGVRPDAVIRGWTSLQPGSPLPASVRPFVAGRVRGAQLGQVVIAALGVQTVLVAPVAQAKALAAAYDGAARYTPPSEVAVPVGMANLWDRAGQMSRSLLRSLPGQAGRVAAGLPLGLRAEAGPDGLRATTRTVMASPDQAEKLLRGVTGELKSAALMFRLLGLPPLHNRLQGQVDGSTLKFDLLIRHEESARLLRLMEAQVERGLTEYCQRRSTAGPLQGQP